MTEEVLIKTVFLVCPDSLTNRVWKTGCFHPGRILGPRGAQHTSSLRIGAANLSIHTLHYSYLLKMHHHNHLCIFKSSNVLHCRHHSPQNISNNAVHHRSWFHFRSPLMNLLFIYARSSIVFLKILPVAISPIFVFIHSTKNQHRDLFRRTL